MKIIDDDEDHSFKNREEIDNEDLFTTNQDLPVIVGVIDERPPELQVQDYRTSDKWKTLAVTAELNRKIKREGDHAVRIKRRDSEESPPRRQFKERDSDESPLRRETKRRDSDASPPRRQIKREISEESPPRKEIKRRNSDESPPRRQIKRRDSDASPPRRHVKQEKQDSSPPRREIKRRYSDESPPRRPNRRRDSDQSPPRRLEGRRDSDASPPRRGRDAVRPPPRRQYSSPSNSRNQRRSSDRRRSPANSRKSPETSRKSPQNSRKSPLNSRKPSRWESDSPGPSRRYQSPEITKKTSKELYIPGRSSSPETQSGSSKKMMKTLDGKASGLQDARTLRRENDLFREKQDRMYQELHPDMLGRNSEVKIRERRGRKRDYEKEMEEEQVKNEKELERKKVYDRWGKGLKQVEATESRLQEMAHEMSKPLARTADDEDLQDYLKNQERLEDPMLQYMRNKKKETNRKMGVEEKPMYQGNYPENRFGIRPGYRWDGVDRSNGYEKKYFDAKSAKKAMEEEAYRYATEDM